MPTLVVNNAGTAHPGGFLAHDSEEAARLDLEANFFGMLRVSKAFAPILAANGGGAFLNVLSVASWINSSALAPYAASKSTAWSLTNSLRFELASQKTQVLALHMGFVDTDLARGRRSEDQCGGDRQARQTFQAGAHGAALNLFAADGVRSS